MPLVAGIQFMNQLSEVMYLRNAATQNAAVMAQRCGRLSPAVAFPSLGIALGKLRMLSRGISIN
jgi:hypothetical protein